MVSHNNNIPDFLECKDCKINFDDMAERQRYIVTEPIGKRGFPKRRRG